MRYRINWTEEVDYFTYVEADSPEAAMEAFSKGDDDALMMTEECGGRIETDSIEATEDPETT